MVFIEMDAKTKRFYQGVAAGSRVSTEHADLELPSHEARLALWWFYVGALAAGEHQLSTSEEFGDFILGATLRAPSETEEDDDET